MTRRSRRDWDALPTKSDNNSWIVWLITNRAWFSIIDSKIRPIIFYPQGERRSFDRLVFAQVAFDIKVPCFIF